MTDRALEERLEAALAARADLAATDTSPLVAGARERAHARRRRTTVLAAGAVAAVVLAAVVLPGRLGQPGRPDEPVGPAGGGPVLVRGDDLQTGSLGWQQVVWHDLTFAVPPDWARGAVDQWCLGGGGAPVVQLPDTSQSEVACSPLRGYGVQVTPHDQRPPVLDPDAYPDGTVLTQVTRSGWDVTVSVPSSKLRKAIVASIEVLGSEDWVGGCPVRQDVPRLGDAVVTADERGPLSVCRYGLGVAGPNLEEAFAGTPSEPVSAAALTAAPRGTGPDATDEECGDWPEDAAVAVVGDGGPVAWVHYAGCFGHGVDLGSRGTRQLTEDVMRLVMTPGWSGGVIGEVPLPLRATSPDGAVSGGG